MIIIIYVLHYWHYCQYTYLHNPLLIETNMLVCLHKYEKHVHREHNYNNSLCTTHTHTHTLVQHTHKHTQNQPAPQQFSVTYAGQRPPNQFVLSFLALCLCAWCWPALVFAILGIVYSIQVTTQCVSLSYSPQNIVVCALK